MHKAAQRELRLAKRMARLGTETAFEVLVKAKALEAHGRDIVHLEIGEPDFDTPRNIIDAGCDALHKGFTHYGPSAGLPQLRETIAHYVSETRRVNATPEEVVVVPGGKPIIFFSILALVEEALYFARRFLQDLRHDRLANGLRRDARRFGGARRPSDDQFQLLHRELHANRRRRSASRIASLGRRDVRRVQETARRDGRWPE